MFVDCKYFPYREKPNKIQAAGLRLAEDKFSDFYAFCQKIKRYFESDLPSAISIPQKSGSNPQSDDDEDEEAHNGRRSRSRAIK